MKKVIALIFVLCMITACKPTEPVVNEVTDTPQVVEPLEEKEVKRIEKSDADNLNDFELLGQYVAEIDAIEGETEINLYTSAQRDKMGELMWDDTQEWVLRAETESGIYVLYDERINGRAYMKVFDSYNNDGAETVIALHIYGNTYDEIREYRFDGEAFEEIIRYTTDETSTAGISELYTSIPQYE